MKKHLFSIIALAIVVACGITIVYANASGSISLSSGQTVIAASSYSGGNVAAAFYNNGTTSSTTFTVYAQRKNVLGNYVNKGNATNTMKSDTISIANMFYDAGSGTFRFIVAHESGGTLKATYSTYGY